MKAQIKVRRNIGDAYMWNLKQNKTTNKRETDSQIQRTN